MTTMITSSQTCHVPNFRKVTGLTNFYRSSAPDNLADSLRRESVSTLSTSSTSSSSTTTTSTSPLSHSQQQQQQHPLSESERFVLYDVTLLVDLRSPNEVDQEKMQALMDGAPGGRFEQVHGLEDMSSCTCKRQILRLNGEDNILTRASFFDYVVQHWVTPSSTSSTKAMSPQECAEAAFVEINKRGLLGFVEVILETKTFIATVLKAITIHLEKNPNGKILINCNVGKDRTGIVVMLCEAMLGVHDHDIVLDFAKSDCIQPLAQQRFHEIFQGKIDSVHFSHAPPETMVLTLKYLRDKYGSIENYLLSISFDHCWQSRFRSAVASS